MNRCSLRENSALFRNKTHFFRFGSSLFSCSSVIVLLHGKNQIELTIKIVYTHLTSVSSGSGGRSPQYRRMHSKHSMANGDSSTGKRSNGLQIGFPCHFTKSACGRDEVERFLARPFNSWSSITWLLQNQNKMKIIQMNKYYLFRNEINGFSSINDQFQNITSRSKKYEILVNLWKSLLFTFSTSASSVLQSTWLLSISKSNRTKK